MKNDTQQNSMLYFCDHCTDPNDPSKGFSGTADEVKNHWLSFHLNGDESTSEPIRNEAIEMQQSDTIFYCDYCINPNDSSKLVSGTLDEIYDHWLASHLDGMISLPFQFHAVDVAKCFHCTEIGTYHDLVEHHKNQHADKFFAISDRLNIKKCGICQFKDGNLIEHFKSSHESVSPPKTFNPVFYSEEKVTELLNIKAEKTHHCIECCLTFHTHAETYKHFAGVHAENGIEANPFIDSNPFVVFQSQPAYLICGFCAKIVDVNQYLNHFKKHSYNFKCSRCTYRSPDLAQLVFHERKIHSNDTFSYHCSVFPDWLRNKNLNTKMVFTNGLVLKYYNVLGTKFDDSKLFDIFIDGILDAKKECLEQMMKSNEMQDKQLSQDATRVAEDPAYVAELKRQRSLKYCLYIGGIRDNLKSMGLQNVFLNLCQKLEVNVTAGDIKQIVEMNANGLSVELYKPELKKMILNRTKNRTIWSSELIQVPKGEHPWKISINNELTPFFTNISKAAMALLKKGVIYSFKMGKDGFGFKRTNTDASKIVRSKQELLDYTKTSESSALVQLI